MTASAYVKRPHPADGMTLQVDCGDGAWMTIVSPQDDPAMEWVLRYGNAEAIRYCVAMTIASYDYLISEPITMKEATRRLRLMRKAYRDAIKAHARKMGEAG